MQQDEAEKGGFSQVIIKVTSSCQWLFSPDEIMLPSHLNKESLSSSLLTFRQIDHDQYMEMVVGRRMLQKGYDGSCWDTNHGRAHNLLRSMVTAVWPMLLA